MKKLFTILALTLVTFTSNAQTYCYDTNGDGEIDIYDVMCLVNKILGNPNPGEEPIAYISCPDENHPHMINLGLPSGTKWSCCNVDADKPESYGGYYAWGEVTEKTTYNWSNYVHCDGTMGSCHFIGEDIAGTEYDVAHVKWGGKWQMPSKEQIKELLDNCTREWIVGTDKPSGLKFTGTNGGTLFFPAAGGYWDDTSHNIGKYGYYWSSTLDTSAQNRAGSFDSYSGNAYTTNSRRLDGCTIRPIWAP